MRGAWRGCVLVAVAVAVVAVGSTAHAAASRKHQVHVLAPKAACPCDARAVVTAKDVRDDARRNRAPNADLHHAANADPPSCPRSDLPPSVCVCRRERRPVSPVRCSRDDVGESCGGQAQDPASLPPAHGRAFDLPDDTGHVHSSRGAVTSTTHLSAASCAELGWRVAPNTQVCGATMVPNCYSHVLLRVALSLCARVGARLCTIGELDGDVTAGTGCGFDHFRTWSSSPCENGTYTQAGSRERAQGQVSLPVLDFARECSPTDSLAAVRCCADTHEGRPSMALHALGCALTNSSLVLNFTDAAHFPHECDIEGDDGLFLPVRALVPLPPVAHVARPPARVVPTVVGLTFEVRAREDVRVLLSTNDGHVGFEIGLCVGPQAISYVRVGKDREMVLSGPTSLCPSPHEFRSYWLTYRGKTLTVGRGDLNSNAVLLHVQSTQELHRVAFGSSPGALVEVRRVCVFDDLHPPALDPHPLPNTLPPSPALPRPRKQHSIETLMLQPPCHFNQTNEEAHDIRIPHTDSPSPSPSLSPPPRPSPVPDSLSPSPSLTSSPTPSRTGSVTPSVSLSPSITPSPSPSASEELEHFDLPLDCDEAGDGDADTMNDALPASSTPVPSPPLPSGFAATPSPSPSMEVESEDGEVDEGIEGPPCNDRQPIEEEMA